MIPKLISISGPMEGTTFSVTDADVTIGRGPSNSICIADPLLSRQHCRITRQGDAFNLHDLGSFNGTFVNGVPIKTQAIAHRRSEEHTSELQSLRHLVCRLLLE